MEPQGTVQSLHETKDPNHDKQVQDARKEVKKILEEHEPKQETKPSGSSVPSDLPIIVVGCGFAGMLTAHLLQTEHQMKVMIVEAADYVGGRVRQTEPWSGHTFDLGAEFIHGSNSLLHELADKLKLAYDNVFEVFERDENKKIEEFYYLGRERKILPINTDDKDVKALWDSFEKLTYPVKESIKRDVSVLKFLVDNGVPLRLLSLCDSLFAKTYAANIENLGFQEFVNEEVRSDSKGYGRENYTIRESLKPLVQHLSKDLDIKLNWQVKKIDYTKVNNIALTNQNGEVLRASRVVVTVPLTILKDGDITFNPALPNSKLKAMKYLEMDTGMKIFLRFKKQFWPSEHHIVICGDTPVNQYWTYPYIENLPPVITGFIMAESARVMAAGGEKRAVDTFLKQLDEIYGTPIDPSPATSNYEAHLMYDWTKQPFIRGAYSSVKVGCLSTHRAILGEPIKDRVYFAGEATSVYAAATIHGAMDSAANAVKQIIEKHNITDPEEGRKETKKLVSKL